MQRDNPSSRILLGAAATCLCLPFLLVLAADRQYGLPAYVRSPAHDPVWAGPLVGLAIIAALYSLLRQVNPLRAGAILGLALLAQVMLLPAWSSASRAPLRVIIEDNQGVPGTEVFCNGGPLGTLPLTLDEASFYQRVVPWEAPPAQQVVGLHVDPDDKLRHWAMGQWLWAFGDPIESFKNWKHDHIFVRLHDDTQFMQTIAAERYWWHFERDGYFGYVRMGGVSGGGGGSGNVYHAHLGDVGFPAADKVADLLIEHLREDDYQPTGEWTTYVLRHRHLLYRRLAARADNEPQLEPVLDELARIHFELPTEPTPADARQALARILEETERCGTFTTPSVESRVIPRLTPLCAELLVDEFRALLPDFPLGNGSSSSEGWHTSVGRGRGARQIPLTFALRFVHPPEIFDALVWLYVQRRSRGDLSEQLLPAIAGYDRPEARAILAQRLREQNHADGVAEAITALDVPAFETEFRTYVSGSSSRINAFVEERIRRGRDLRTLADWIVSLGQVSIFQKSRWLARIDDPRAVELLVGFTRDRGTPVDHDNLGWLARRPQARLDRYVLELKRRLNESNPQTTHSAIEHAILATDSSAMREHIAELASGDRRDWNRLVSSPPAGPLVHLDWLVPTIRDFSDDQRRGSSCQLLAAIGTPAAIGTLEDWSRDANRGVAREATAALQKREQQQAETAARRRQTAALLSGEMSPQELLTLRSFVWRDGQYVEE